MGVGEDDGGEDPSVSYTLYSTALGLVIDEETYNYEYLDLPVAPGSTVDGGGEATGSVLETGGSVVVSGTRVTLTPETLEFTDNDGNRWEHAQWLLYAGKVTFDDLLNGSPRALASSYYTPEASFRLNQDATLVRVWELGPETSEEIEVSTPS